MRVSVPFPCRFPSVVSVPFWLSIAPRASVDAWLPRPPLLSHAGAYVEVSTQHLACLVSYPCCRLTLHRINVGRVAQRVATPCRRVC